MLILVFSGYIDCRYFSICVRLSKNRTTGLIQLLV